MTPTPPPANLIPHLLRTLARSPYHPSSIHFIGLFLFPILEFKVKRDEDIWSAFVKVHGEEVELRVYGRVPEHEDRAGLAVDIADGPNAAASGGQVTGEDRTSGKAAGCEEEDLWGISIFTTGHVGRKFARCHIWISSESDHILSPSSPSHVSNMSARQADVFAASSSLLNHILRSFLFPATRRTGHDTLMFASLNRIWTSILKRYVQVELGGEGAEVLRDGPCTKVAKRIRIDPPVEAAGMSDTALPALPPGYAFRPPQKTDVPCMIEHNALKFDKEYMENLIWLGCVVEDEASGEPVGWSLSHEDLSFCASHTIPEVRKLGIGTALIHAMSYAQTREIQASPYNPYSDLRDRGANERGLSTKQNGDPKSGVKARRESEESYVWVHGDSEEYNQATLDWFERQGFQRVVGNVWLSVRLDGVAKDN